MAAARVVWDECHSSVAHRRHIGKTCGFARALPQHEGEALITANRRFTGDTLAKPAVLPVRCRSKKGRR